MKAVMQCVAIALATVSGPALADHLAGQIQAFAGGPAVITPGAVSESFQVSVGPSYSTVPAHCTGGGPFAYIDASAPNYKTVVAIIISARSLGQTVDLYTTAVSDPAHPGQTICRLDWISTHS